VRAEPEDDVLLAERELGKAEVEGAEEGERSVVQVDALAEGIGDAEPCVLGGAEMGAHSVALNASVARLMSRSLHRRLPPTLSHE